MVLEQALFYEEQLKEEISKDREEHGKKPLKDNDDDDDTLLGGKLKEVKVSTTGPDSGLFHKGEHKDVMAYCVQTACDENGYILGYSVDAGNKHDSRTFIDIYEKVKRFSPEMVIADSGYKTPAIAKKLIDEGIVPILPYTRPKTRFAKFHNLPELMMMFKDVADIQTADMLKLPVPNAEHHTVALKPSEYQVDMVKSLGERAEAVRAGNVDASRDNMLVITNDGRKLALDQRMINELLPESETGKVNACCENVYKIWSDTKEIKSTQMVFCDLSTPSSDKFNVYDTVKDKLISMGIPEDEIAYIHNAKTEKDKKELFGKVRSGTVRVLIGSTQKMGAGTNVQTKLKALHHLVDFLSGALIGAVQATG